MIHVPCQRLDLKMCLKIQGGVQANQGHYLGLFGLIWRCGIGEHDVRT
jgi:hypothetical protein